MKDIRDIIERMTLEEKASLTSGRNFWNTCNLDHLGIPSIMITDGPHGIRKQGGKADHLGLHLSIPATCFPPAATLANSWDEELLEEVGQALGREAATENVRVILGPGLNLKRNPLCGRNFEYYSEDPLLAGKLAAAGIRGIQSTGTGACPKHFAVNSQEHMRMTIDEVVDERALRELYLEGFRIAVHEGQPEVLMSSYNRINGEYANENTHLLRDILSMEWGFNGVVVTDWGGNNDRVAGLKAGNQLEMPSSGGVTDREIVEAVTSGNLEESLLDQRIEELLRLILRSRQKPAVPVDYAAAHETAVRAAEQSLVLLRNEERILPLHKEKSLAVIGDFAFTPRFQGAGSSLINPTRLDIFSDLIESSPYDVAGMSRGYKRYGGKNAILRKQAIKTAGNADHILLFLGLDEGSEAEGVDRTHMKLPQNQLDLVEDILEVNSNVIVILSGGTAVELPFAERVKGIVYSCLGGQGGARALYNVLSGKSNPSGKLAETFPVEYSQVPSARYYPGRENSSEHRESIYIGYRYYCTAKVPVRYPFGFGLSYSSFEYRDLKIERDSGLYRVHCVIKNSGNKDGAEIIQLYISPESSKVFRSEQELKGFKKVELKGGEEKEVNFTLKHRDFAYYNTKSGNWSVESGSYEIRIGASCEDIRLKKDVTVKGDDTENPYDREAHGPYYRCEMSEIQSGDFARLLDFPLPPLLWDRHKMLGFDDTFAQTRYKIGLGALIYWSIRGVRGLLFFLGKPLAANNIMFLMNMPFRQIERFSKGKISGKAVATILKIINWG